MQNWESEFEYCRVSLRKLSDMTGVSYDNIRFLFADELFEACKTGRIAEKKDIINSRKSKRAFAEAYWDKCMKDALAGDVVVDTGGTLSHAAIVAREYGIPAVLATGDATLKLKDNDMVLVNATEGSVTVLA